MKKINLHIFTHFLWLIPFVSFLGGYQLLSWLYNAPVIETPNVIGMTTAEALPLLSEHKINPRILTTQERPDLPPNTIVHQNPSPKTKIKQNQTLFLVVSTQQEPLSAPELTGKTLPHIMAVLKQLGIRYKLYYLQGPYPKEYCISQFPPPGHLLKNNKILIYVCNGTPKPIVMPNFKNKPVTQILEFLQNHQVQSTITHRTPEHSCTPECIVSDQRPLAGSFITLDNEKPLTVHLQVA